MASRTARLVLVSLVAAGTTLASASSSQAVPVSDNFNRADSTDLGAGWSEVVGTDLAIANNELTNPQQTSALAVAVGGTGNRVTARVGNSSFGGAWLALVVGYTSAADLVFVKAYDSDGNGSLDRISVSRSNNGTAVDDRPATAFLGGFMTVTLVGQRVRVTVANQGSPPHTAETFVLTDTPTGTGVGATAFKSAFVDDFASSDFVPSNPTITGALTSDFAPTSFGWYRTNVFVDYTCTEDGSPLEEPCPTGEIFAEEGTNTATHTIYAVDGGSDSVTVSAKLDTTAPTATLGGIVRTPYLEDPTTTATCSGTDALSGVASCAINSFELGGGKVRVEALATDKAGNQAVDEAVVTTATAGILKATYKKGRYEVVAGKKYVVVVLGKKSGGKIFLVGVGDVPADKAFTYKNGRWELRVKIPAGAKAGKSAVSYRKKGRTLSLPIVVRRP